MTDRSNELGRRGSTSDSEDGSLEPAVQTRTESEPGARLNEQGAIFVIRSKHATTVDVAIFDDHGQETTIRCDRVESDLYRAEVAGLRAGQLYGYRVDGPWDPASGQRFNPAKLIVDPWAKAIEGKLDWHPAVYGDLRPTGDDQDSLDPLSRDPRDSAPHVPRSVLVDLLSSQRPQPGPAIPWSRTVLYEAHVRGLTRLHPAVPPEQRGTYLGLASRPVIEHLLSLGVTAIELMPVHHAESELHLHRSGLTNYWGYSPLGHFAPDARFATGSRGEQVAEFRQMVDALHTAGLEVILDIVLNHTVEGDHRGPTLSLRGLDNASFYRLGAKGQTSDRSRYVDFTGCGNTLDFSQEMVVDYALDCLRFWVVEMGVDGFRFDLAPVLGRAGGDDGVDFSPDAPFFERLAKDPVLGQTKLIAEPWDLGPEGYRLGEFPAPWAEWNDRFRDRARSFWRGDAMPPAKVVVPLAASPDLLDQRPSIHAVTSHDGFTLVDLVSYEHKHNLANGEDNRDGRDHNLSSNSGVEGPTDETNVLERRLALRRALLATVALSSGVPMVSHGDELGRTQGGNNNAYCQDNETTWVDWEPTSGPGADPESREFLSYVRSLFEARRRLPWLSAPGTLVRWLDQKGKEHRAASATPRPTLAFAVLWRAPVEHGRQRLLVFLNATDQTQTFVLPEQPPRAHWSLILNTSDRYVGRDSTSIRVPPVCLVALLAT